jgi:hypothetical protein
MRLHVKRARQRVPHSWRYRVLSTESCHPTIHHPLTHLLSYIDLNSLAQIVVQICHSVVKRQTVPRGFDCSTVVHTGDDSTERWVNTYTDTRRGGKASNIAPHGTFSFAEGLHRRSAKSQSSERTSVARPTIFISHAWTFKWSVLLEAIRAFVAAENLEPASTYFWIDILCVNQHNAEGRPPEWWSSIFKDAVQAIGWTVCVLAPWDDPKPLTRAWCRECCTLRCTSHRLSSSCCCFPSSFPVLPSRAPNV